MQKTLADYEKQVYELFDPLNTTNSIFKIAEVWYNESNPVENRVVPKIAERFPINITLWGRVLSSLDKKTLFELCKKYNIKIDTAKQRGRKTMGDELAKKIDVNKRMFLEITFD